MADVTLTVTGLSSTSTLGDPYAGAADGWGRFQCGRAYWGYTNFVEQGWGREFWGYQSWGDTPIVSLTGLTATTSLGIPDELIEVKPGWGTLTWGQNGWGSVESATETLTGLSLTSSLGTVTAEDVVGLTGFSLTSTLNSLSAVKTDFTTTLTGFGLVSSFGLLSVDDHSVGLPGLSATSTVGSLSPADAIGISGLSASTAVGSITITSNPLELLTALTPLSTALGTVTATPETIAALTGQSGTTSLGTPTTVQVSNANLDGLGLTATTSLNDNLILRYYQRLAPKTSSGYTRITAKTSTGYTRKTP